MTIPAFPAPSCAMILEWVAFKHGSSGAHLRDAHAHAKDNAAWLMREFDYPWHIIASAVGYASSRSARDAARRWERMRRRKAR